MHNSSSLSLGSLRSGSLFSARGQNSLEILVYFGSQTTWLVGSTTASPVWKVKMDTSSKESYIRPSSPHCQWRRRSNENSNTFEAKSSAFKKFSSSFKKKHTVDKRQFEQYKISLNSGNDEDITNCKLKLNEVRKGDRVSNTITVESSFEDLVQVKQDNDHVIFVPKFTKQKLYRTRYQEEFIQVINTDTSSTVHIHRGYIYVCLDRMGTIEHLVTVSKKEVEDEKKSPENLFRSFQSCNRKRRQNTYANVASKRWVMWKDILIFLAFTRRFLMRAVIDCGHFFLNWNVCKWNVYSISFILLLKTIFKFLKKTKKARKKGKQENNIKIAKFYLQLLPFYTCNEIHICNYHS